MSLYKLIKIIDDVHSNNRAKVLDVLMKAQYVNPQIVSEKDPCISLGLKFFSHKNKKCLNLYYNLENDLVIYQPEIIPFTSLTIPCLLGLICACQKGEHYINAYFCRSMTHITLDGDFKVLEDLNIGNGDLSKFQKFLIAGELFGEGETGFREYPTTSVLNEPVFIKNQIVGFYNSRYAGNQDHDSNFRNYTNRDAFNDATDGQMDGFGNDWEDLGRD